MEGRLVYNTWRRFIFYELLLHGALSASEDRFANPEHYLLPEGTGNLIAYVLTPRNSDLSVTKVSSHRLTNPARRMASNFAKLPELLSRG